MEKQTEHPEEPVKHGAVIHPTNKNSVTEAAPEELLTYISAVSAAISGKPIESSIDSYQQELEESMLIGVQNLPERLAERFGAVDPAPYLERARALRSEMEQATDVDTLSTLQQECIFQYLAIISRVQNGGDKGITPAVAEEIGGIDCSLSAWCLKEKLQGIPQLTYQFGSPTGHAVGIVTLANGDTLYVDAQNGFAVNVTLKQVEDEQAPKTGYPIYEIDEESSKRVTATLPGEGIVDIARSDGCEYVPKYVGVREHGLDITVSNFHMLLHPTSPIFATNAAKNFRKGLDIQTPVRLEAVFDDISPAAYARFQVEGKNDNDMETFLREALLEHYPESAQEAEAYAHLCHEKWNEFNQRFVPRVTNGATLYDTKYGELAQQHHDAWEAMQLKGSL